MLKPSASPSLALGRFLISSALALSKPAQSLPAAVRDRTVVIRVVLLVVVVVVVVVVIAVAAAVIVVIAVVVVDTSIITLFYFCLSRGGYCHLPV